MSELHTINFISTDDISEVNVIALTEVDAVHGPGEEIISAFLMIILNGVF